MHNLGQQLIDLLQSYGVDTVFGIPGVHTVEMYRGLQGSGIRHVSSRHEQSLGFMADGYARTSGKPGVCFVITGPGVTNILTAMGQAYADSIPMLVISGVNPFGRMGSGNGYLHELPDQRGMTEKVCAFSHTITHPDELPQVLARAFAVFESGRPRPVHIEIPLNLMAAPVADKPRKTLARVQPGAASMDAVRTAAALLQKSQRPLICVGGGAIAAAAEVQLLAEQLGAPVVMTINARGILPAGHPLGISASPSFPAVRGLLAQSDLLLAIGTEIGPTDYDCYDTQPFATDVPLIRLDIDAQQIMRNLAPDVALLGDARATLQLLLDALPTRALAGVDGPAVAGGSVAPSSGAQRALTARAQGLAELPVAMQADMGFLHAVRDRVPNALWVGDSTRLVYAGNMGFEALRPRSWFNSSVGFGALGYGLPAAVGAALADPDRTVVCLVGDGGLQFTLAELGTAMEVGARVVVVLLNNQGYGEIKSAMQAIDVEPVGVDLHTPNFVAVAQAYGWQAHRIGRGQPQSQWAEHIGSVVAGAAGPTLIEILV
jgi:acetolactate synthase-1/2/3 large subunit